MDLLKYIFAIYILQDMSTRFFMGLGLGIFLGSEYNLKPYVDFAKKEATDKFSELIKKLDAIKKQ